MTLTYVMHALRIHRHMGPLKCTAHLARNSLSPGLSVTLSRSPDYGSCAGCVFHARDRWGMSFATLFQARSPRIDFHPNAGVTLHIEGSAFTSSWRSELSLYGKSSALVKNCTFVALNQTAPGAAKKLHVHVTGVQPRIYTDVPQQAIALWDTTVQHPTGGRQHAWRVRPLAEAAGFQTLQSIMQASSPALQKVRCALHCCTRACNVALLAR